MLILELPVVLSANQCYRAVGRMVKISKKGRENKKSLVASVHDQLGGIPDPLMGDISIIVRVYPKDKRKRDLDNYFKMLFDALTAAQVWGDDSQVKHIDATMCEIVKFGKTIVEISEINLTEYKCI